jgi:hypothetical protein
MGSPELIRALVAFVWFRLGLHGCCTLLLYKYEPVKVMFLCVGRTRVAATGSFKRANDILMATSGFLRAGARPATAPVIASSMLDGEADGFVKVQPQLET